MGIYGFTVSVCGFSIAPNYSLVSGVIAVSVNPLIIKCTASFVYIVYLLNNGELRLNQDEFLSACPIRVSLSFYQCHTHTQTQIQKQISNL